MHVAGTIPGIHHVAFVAQRLGELIERPAIGVVDLVQRSRFLVRIRRLGRNFFEFTGSIQRFGSRVKGLFCGGVRFLGRRRVGRPAAFRG